MRRDRTETIVGKFPAIFNGHHPPRADDPYMKPCIVCSLNQWCQNEVGISHKQYLGRDNTVISHTPGHTGNNQFFLVRLHCCVINRKGVFKRSFACIGHACYGSQNVCSLQKCMLILVNSFQLFAKLQTFARYTSGYSFDVVIDEAIWGYQFII